MVRMRIRFVCIVLFGLNACTPLYPSAWEIPGVYVSQKYPFDTLYMERYHLVHGIERGRYHHSMRLPSGMRTYDTMYQIQSLRGSYRPRLDLPDSEARPRIIDKSHQTDDEQWTPSEVLLWNFIDNRDSAHYCAPYVARYQGNKIVLTNTYQTGWWRDTNYGDYIEIK